MGRILKKTTFSLGAPGRFITDSEAIYESDVYGKVVVEKEFSTDFASIPNWIPRWLFDPLRHGRWPALFHDDLCQKATTYKERVMADHVFFECMTDVGTKKWRKLAMFAAVRANTYRMRLMGKWK